MPEAAKRNSARSLTKATYRNAISLLGNYVASIAVGLVANPILLHLLGAYDFGVWHVCLRMLTFASAADGRATQALKYTIAHKSGAGNERLHQRNVGSAVLMWCAFLPIMLLGAAIVTWLGPHVIRGLRSTDYSIVRVVCLLLAADMIFVPVRSIPQAVMVGLNMGYRCTWLESVRVVLLAIVSIVAAYRGFQLIGLSVSWLLVSIAVSLLALQIARVYVPWMRFRMPRTTEVRAFAGFSVWVMMWSLVNKVALASDVLVIGAVASARMVAVFLCLIMLS